MWLGHTSFMHERPDAAAPQGLNSAAPISASPRAGPGPLVSWPRVRLWLLVTLVWALIRTMSSVTPFAEWLARCGLATALGVLAFDLADRWPRQTSSWSTRWIWHLLAVLIAMPPATYLGYALTVGQLNVLALGPGYRDGWFATAFLGVLVGPWIALGALLHRSEAFAQAQAQDFQLKSSELERKALDARLRLLQAQVEPHFLFNTLANIRSMVRRSGSEEATAMLDNLIAYLRAAVPEIEAEDSTFEQERRIVCAYLELMRMRMPDRLEYAVRIDQEASTLYCPPMGLLTLVENAIKHGIDPSETGGRVDVQVTVSGPRVHVRVADTGVGLRAGSRNSLGTGLSNLRERLELVFGQDAQVRLVSGQAAGMVAEAEFPVRHGGRA
ncbi:sensor histidine kinase [Paucibacter sp. KBW04]|nr:sensor histidine kinase [Paucibacter sp. KBW04]